MDSEVKLYLERAENKIIIAKASFEISLDNNKKEQLGIPINQTFFNDVISHAYYAIFYSAKAYLISKEIKTKAPEEHKKTYEEFKKIIASKLNNQLVDIYDTETTKAEVLLNIFFTEKRKRGRFTYNIKSEANIPYARESIDNAVKFVSIIKNIIDI
mgnify:CR=1 FL=1